MISNKIIFLTYKIIFSLLYKILIAFSLKYFFNFNFPFRQHGHNKQTITVKKLND